KRGRIARKQASGGPQELPLTRRGVEAGSPEQIRDARLLERVLEQPIDRLGSPQPGPHTGPRLEDLEGQVHIEAVAAQKRRVFLHLRCHLLGLLERHHLQARARKQANQSPIYQPVALENDSLALDHGCKGSAALPAFASVSILL